MTSVSKKDSKPKDGLQCIAKKQEILNAIESLKYSFLPYIKYKYILYSLILSHTI